MSESNPLNVPDALKGRPDKLTPQRAKFIIQAVGETTPLEVACAAVSIRPRSLGRYRDRARKYLADPVRYAKYEKFYQFFQDVQQAQAMAELLLVNIIRGAAKTSTADAKWLLERRFKKRWVPTQAVEHSGRSGSGPVEFVLSVPKPMASDAMATEDE